MAKDNLFLGFGRGTVGDVVFYRQGGQQVARARNRAPKNPQTALQLLQRVVLKTSSMAYALMQDICNHSFQGFAEGTECQSRFNKLNIQKFREQLVNEINSGDAEEIMSSAESNFAASGTSLTEFNAYQVSEGSLTRIPVTWGASLGTPTFMVAVDLGSAAPTYADVLAALNLVSGDQLTFLGLSTDDTQENGNFNGFEYARVILEPASGDLTEPFISGTGINDPNDKNRGDFRFGIAEDGGAYYLTFIPSAYSESAGVLNAYGAATVIVSRSNGSVWQRSSQELVLRTDRITVAGHLICDHNIDYMGDAVQSFMTAQSSLLYLNQAGGSGKRGVPIATPRLSAVVVGTQPLARGGSLTLAVNTGNLTATLTGDSEEAEYTLALRAHGASTNFKEATFTSSSATISNIGIVADTEYDVILLENGEVIDTYGTILYTTAQAATLSEVTVAGQTIERDGRATPIRGDIQISAIKRGGSAGISYVLAIRAQGQTTNYKEADFDGNFATITKANLQNGVTYDVVLLGDGVVLDTFCEAYYFSE